MPASDEPPARPDGPGLRALLNELVRLETELWEAVEGRVRAEHGVPLGSYEVMSVIDGRPGCRVQDIAADLSITVGGVSKIVDRIEVAGLCARRANPGDRRSSIIELTPAGAGLLAQLTRTVEDELARRLGPVLPGLPGLTRTLTRLRSAVRDSAATQEASR